MSDLMNLALFLVVVDWLVALLLVLAAFLPPRIAALSERSVAAVAIAVVSSVGWYVLDNARGGTPLPSDTVQLIGAGLIVALSLPALWWLVQYLRGRFR